VFLVELARVTPLLPGAEQLTFVDVDSLLRRVYGRAKQGSGFGHATAGGYWVLLRGLSPLIATLSTPLAAPVIAAPPAPASTTPTGSTSDRPTSPRGHSRSPSSWGAARRLPPGSIGHRRDVRRAGLGRPPRRVHLDLSHAYAKPGTSGTWRRWSTSTLPTAPRRPASGLIRLPRIWCSRWTGEPGAGSESWTVCATGSASGGWFTGANNEPHAPVSIERVIRW